MTFQRMFGIVLIAVGVFFLAYGGITYTTRKKVLDIGPVQATKREQKSVPIPPILGGAILAGGIGLIAFSSGKGN